MIKYGNLKNIFTVFLLMNALFASSITTNPVSGDINELPLDSNITNQSIIDVSTSDKINLDESINDANNPVDEIIDNFYENSDLNEPIINTEPTDTTSNSILNEKETITFNLTDLDVIFDEENTNNKNLSDNDPLALTDIQDPDWSELETINITSKETDNLPNSDNTTINLSSETDTLLNTDIPNSDWNGEEIINLNTEDTDNLTDSDNAMLNITPLNDPKKTQGNPNLDAGEINVDSNSYLTSKGPNPIGGGGAIWTTRYDCGDDNQNVNEYCLGDPIFINGEGFDPYTELNWNITGLPGSCDPNTIVANGTNFSDDNGAFCFPAYNIKSDDCGGYKVTVNKNKNDNYNVIVCNYPPVANNDYATVLEGGIVTILDSGNDSVLDNDTDLDGDSLSSFLVSDPSNGFLILNIDGTFSYTHDGSETTSDSFVYIANDSLIDSNEATVYITVGAVNDDPVATDDYANVDEDSINNQIDVLPNDDDIDGDPLTITSVTTPSHGTATNDNDYTYYTPNTNYNGPDQFTYTISDGQGGTDTATVYITVGAVNDPPNANDDTANTQEDTPVNIDVTANDNDLDGDLLTIVSVTAPINGFASTNGLYALYTPNPNYNGPDQFSYTISDCNGGTNNAIVYITVISVNDPPVLSAIGNQNVDENGLLTVPLSASDLDGDDLTFSTSILPYFATFYDNGDGTGSILFVPNFDDSGFYDITVNVTDNNVPQLSDEETFTLTVDDINRPPYILGDPDPFNGKTSVNLSPVLSINVSDLDGDVLYVKFYDASDDSIIGIDVGVISGDVASVVWSGLSYSKVFSWYVVVNDSQLEYTSDIWSFTTKGAPKTIPINNNPIADASAGAPYIGFVGEDITFDGSLSYDPDPHGYIISWHWNFDDGTNGYGEIVTHNYSSTGIYNVTLRVTDNEGAIDMETYNVIITTANNPPENLVVDGPLTGKQNTDYEYTASATDLDDDDMLRFIFDWGDGTTTTSEVVGSGVDATVSHNWSKYGIYNVTVIAEDNYSAQIFTTFSVLIDVIIIDGEIKGLIIDEDGNDPFDIFNNSETKGETDVEFENESYLIDSDGDKKWDYAYNPEDGLLTYYEYVYQKFFAIYQVKKATPGFEIVPILAVIALLAIILRKKRKNN